MTEVSQVWKGNGILKGKRFLQFRKRPLRKEHWPTGDAERISGGERIQGKPGEPSNRSLFISSPSCLAFEHLDDTSGLHKSTKQHLLLSHQISLQIILK
jgi:hypothetical protein